MSNWHKITKRIVSSDDATGVFNINVKHFDLEQKARPCIIATNSVIISKQADDKDTTGKWTTKMTQRMTSPLWQNSLY